jgi:hypothetical protein
MKGTSVMKSLLIRTIWFLFLLSLIIGIMGGLAYAQGDFTNRWWPNGDKENIPTSVPPPVQTTTTTTVITPYQTTVTTVTTPLVCCTVGEAITPSPEVPAPKPPAPAPPKTGQFAPAPTAPAPPPATLELPAPQKEARVWSPPPVVAPPPVVVPKPRPHPQQPRYYRPQPYYYEDEYCCRGRLQDLSVPADRVNRGTSGCNGVACYP